MTSPGALLIDAILLGVLVEAIVLWWWGRRRMTRRAMLSLFATLTAGACLLLAVRAAILASTAGMLAALSASLIAHATYLFIRLRDDGGV